MLQAKTMGALPSIHFFEMAFCEHYALLSLLCLHCNILFPSQWGGGDIQNEKSLLHRLRHGSCSCHERKDKHHSHISKLDHHVSSHAYAFNIKTCSAILDILDNVLTFRVHWTETSILF